MVSVGSELWIHWLICFPVRRFLIQTRDKESCLTCSWRRWHSCQVDLPSVQEGRESAPPMNLKHLNIPLLNLSWIKMSAKKPTMKKFAVINPVHALEKWVNNWWNFFSYSTLLHGTKLHPNCTAGFHGYNINQRPRQALNASWKSRFYGTMFLSPNI